MPVTTRRKEAVSHEKANASSSSTELQFPSSSNKKRRIAVPRQQTSPSEIFYFQGKEYGSYVEMVEAKRERNRQMLESSGLIDTAKLIRSEQEKSTKPSKRGLAAIKPKRTSNNTVPPPIRKSKRLAGVSSEQIYVENESHGKIVVNTSSAGHPTETIEANQKFFNGRVNDGSDLTIEQATLLCGEKWRTPLIAAQKFVSNDLRPTASFDLMSNISRLFTRTVSGLSRIVSPQKTQSPVIATQLKEQVQSLHADDESYVAKVTPDRIYSVAFHPSPSVLIACAGDKQGYLGLWNVDKSSDINSTDDYDGVHLFKIHTSPISCLQWNALGSALYSISYDSTVRKFDVTSQKISEAFATYDSSEKYKGKMGFDMDDGNRAWIQYGCLDPKNEENMFLSTSAGNVLHLDFRAGTVNFNVHLSEKKINTVSPHPNGTTLATSGLDNTLRLWDIRNLGSSTNGSDGKKAKEFSSWQCGKSINSAFFSPSGTKLLCTTMANTIDIINEAHLQTGTNMQHIRRIRHDNQTGRWLTTFQAQWHPSGNEDLFAIGSMQRPRRIEVFDGSSGNLIRGIEGDAMVSVSSRCCFHPSQEKLVVCGGNSSGRLIICR